MYSFIHLCIYHLAGGSETMYIEMNEEYITFILTVLPRNVNSFYFPDFFSTDVTTDRQR